LGKVGRKEAVTKDEHLTIKRQSELLEVNRTSFYYEPKEATQEEKEREELIKSRIDYWHTKYCYMGVRRIKAKLEKEDGIKVGRKLIKRYMEEMNICAVYPKPNLSKRDKRHPVFPYLLKNLNIFMPNQVWAVDITFIKMGKSHMYLTAVIDWYSRLVVGWALSDTLDTVPVLDAVKKAIEEYGVPAIINSDQGSQFTSGDYTDYLKGQKIKQSMDGKARWVDNVIIERWFRSLKCENIYINEYNTPKELRRGVRMYIEEYNFERPHSGIGGNYPAEAFANAFAA
jgi:putative transposase